MIYGNGGNAEPNFLIFKLLLRPWDLSHRLERQELMVNTREEMSMRVRQDGEWLAHFYIRVLVSMFYLRPCNHIYIYICMYTE